MAKDWGQIGGIAGVVGAIAAVAALGLAVKQDFFGTFAKTQNDDGKGCNGFLIKENPVILSKKAIPDAVETDNLQKKIFSCRDELQKNDKNAVAYTNIGEATRRLGDLPVALIAQQEAVKLDPNLQEARIGLGLVQFFMGQAAEANKTLQVALAQKESPIIYFYLGVSFGQQKDWKSAEASFRRSIDLDSNYTDAHYNLGVTLGKQGKTADAISAYQKAVSLNPDFAEAYTNLGVVLYEQDNLEEAISAFQKAIGLDPNLVEAYSNLGGALAKQGKTADAISAFQKAISLNPNYAEVYFNLGTTFLYTQGKTADAISAFRKAISLNPKYAEAYGNLGTALYEQENLEEAISAFQKAILLNPNDANAHRNWGVILGSQGNEMGAISKLKKARDLYRAQGETQEANKITQFLERVGTR